MSEFRSWETFAAIVSGRQATVCGSDAMIISWAPAAADGHPPQSTRIVKVTPPAAAAGASAWGCFTSGLFGSAAAAAPKHTLIVSSLIIAPDDPKPTKVRADTVVNIGTEGAVRPEHAASILAAVWEHSRTLWSPLPPDALIDAERLEQSLPLSTPVSVCFKVCVGLAARIARPRHTVSHYVRSPHGGSAILKSPAFGAGQTLVINAEFGTATVMVIGKREHARAVKTSRAIARNLEVMEDDRGWRRRRSDPVRLRSGCLEVALFLLVQALVEVIEAQAR